MACSGCQFGLCRQFTYWTIFLPTPLMSEMARSETVPCCHVWWCFDWVKSWSVIKWICMWLGSARSNCGGVWHSGGRLTCAILSYPLCVTWWYCHDLWHQNHDTLVLSLFVWGRPGDWGASLHAEPKSALGSHIWTMGEPIITDIVFIIIKDISAVLDMTDLYSLKLASFSLLFPSPFMLFPFTMIKPWMVRQYNTSHKLLLNGMGFFHHLRSTILWHRVGMLMVVSVPNW